MQDGSSARAQRPRRLMTVQFTRQIGRDTSVDSPELNRPIIDVYMHDEKKCTGITREARHNEKSRQLLSDVAVGGWMACSYGWRVSPFSAQLAELFI